VPAEVVEALVLLSGSPPPAVAGRILVVLDHDDRIGLLHDDKDPDESCLVEAIRAIEQHGPRLEPYARDVLTQLDPTEWMAPDGEPAYTRVVPLSWIWGVLYPRIGTRLVTLDLDQLRADHARLRLQWDAA
jgi:hypothetical protein